MNIDQYTKVFENLNPADKLDSISGKADSLISAAKTFATGGSKLLFC